MGIRGQESLETLLGLPAGICLISRSHVNFVHILIRMIFFVLNLSKWRVVSKVETSRSLKYKIFDKTPSGR